MLLARRKMLEELSHLAGDTIHERAIPKAMRDFLFPYNCRRRYGFTRLVRCRLAEPFTRQQIQLVIEEPLGRPGKDGLMQMPIALPGLRAPIEKTQRAIGVYVDVGVRLNVRPQNPHIRRTPGSIDDFDPVETARLARLNPASACQTEA